MMMEHQSDDGWLCLDETRIVRVKSRGSGLSGHDTGSQVGCCEDDSGESGFGDEKTMRVRSVDDVNR